MQYQEIRIELASEHAPPLVDLLCERELGFQQCDQTTLEPPPPGRARFCLYLPQTDAAAVPELLEAVHELLPPAAAVAIAIRDRDEDEWRDAWKRYFTTRRVGRIAIVPSWEAAAHTPLPGEVTLAMDPGRAFGTGGHATTRLCLRLLAELQAEPAFAAAQALTILDIGCGCGVLAIAALLLWPQGRVLGVDIDPEAIEVTLENAERNGVAARLRAETTLVDEVPGRFALLLANITGPTLLELSSAMVARLLPGGALILSGLLQTEAEAVKRRFLALGLLCVRDETEEEWAGLLLRQPASALTEPASGPRVLP
jgi:ribosomal protein L11 methyltransferase